MDLPTLDKSLLEDLAQQVQSGEITQEEADRLSRMIGGSK
jgi:hypothetical protein